MDGIGMLLPFANELHTVGELYKVGGAGVLVGAGIGAGAGMTQPEAERSDAIRNGFLIGGIIGCALALGGALTI